ncbi:MAG: hypothetical protein EZS28_040001, partial [Streblomastix strix]
DLVSPSSDLYHSLTFENININDKKYWYVKTYYPNKYMLAWKLATDDSFIRGIVDNYKIDEVNLIPENQNTLAGFMSTRSYPMCWQTGLTPMLHLLCDTIIRIMFEDNSEPQVLNLEVIGEIGGSMITAG